MLSFRAIDLALASSPNSTQSLLVLDHRNCLRNQNSRLIVCEHHFIVSYPPLSQIPDDPKLESLFTSQREIAYLHPELRVLPRLVAHLQLPYMSQLLHAEVGMHRQHVIVNGDVTRKYRSCLLAISEWSARVLTEAEKTRLQMLGTTLMVIVDRNNTLTVRYTVGNVTFRSARDVQFVWLEEHCSLVLGAAAACMVDSNLLTLMAGVPCR